MSLLGYLGGLILLVARQVWSFVTPIALMAA